MLSKLLATPAQGSSGAKSSRRGDFAMVSEGYDSLDGPWNLSNAVQVSELKNLIWTRVINERNIHLGQLPQVDVLEPIVVCSDRFKDRSPPCENSILLHSRRGPMRQHRSVALSRPFLSSCV